jgi:protein transport protein SEC24
LHDLDDNIALPHESTGIIEYPSNMRASHLFMDGNGIYLLGEGGFMRIRSRRLT